MLINDAVANPAYNMDFAKFLSTITGGGSAGPGGLGAPAGAPVGIGGAATAAYY